MKSQLLNIKGINIGALPFELKKVGDLLFFDGSLMGVYKDTHNNPYIFDWVDSDDAVNRWLVYQIERELLAEYVYGVATHSQLINNSANDILFVVDINKDKIIQSCLVISPKNIPYPYLPANHLKFDEEDAINLDGIINTFQLNDIQEHHKKTGFNVLEEAKKDHSELINIHINSKNNKVGFGKIRSSILGEALVNFHKLSEATAFNLFDNKSEGSNAPVRRKRGEIATIKELADYEFVYAKAASFSVFLRPIRNHTDLFTNETSTERIAHQVFDLFKASTEVDNLRKFSQNLSDGVINAYTSFLKNIKENDVSITVQYGNPEKEYFLKDTFDIKKSIKIIQNLDVLELEEVEEIKSVGTFKALDSISNAFKFESNEEDIYIGRFSEQIKESISLFNLRDLYEVVIEIKREKRSGKNQIKERETMVSCVKLE